MAQHRVLRRTALAAAAVTAAAVSGCAGQTATPPSTPAAVPASGQATTQAVASVSAAATTKLPARLYYLGKGNSVQVAEGSGVRTLFTPRTPACGLSISPDRSRISWVKVNGGGATGDLIVAEPDGTGSKTVLNRVSCTGGNVPSWLPGSQHLLLTRGNTNPRVQVDAQNGFIEPHALRDVKGYVALSPSGKYLAYQQAGKVVVAHYDGAVVHRFAHGSETPTGGFSVQGVSDDGRRVVLGMTNSDPDQIRTGFRLVDAVTGKNVRGSVGTALYPAPGNTLLVRTGGKVTLLAADGQVLGSRTEPAALRTSTLLAGY